MIRLVYSLLGYALLPAALLRLLWRSRRLPAYRQRLAERCGWQRPVAAGGLWLHAVSVGEVVAAAPLIESLSAREPLLVTTTTPTGAERLAALFGDRVAHRYLPYDTPTAAARFFDRHRPRAGLIMETELWPNLFAAARRRGVPMALLNARLSARSARRYARVPGLIAPALAGLRLVAAVGKADARRLAVLGADRRRLRISGNIKFDQALSRGGGAALPALRGVSGVRPVWVAASTHAGEEALVLAAHRRVLETHPAALLLLAPRHPDRFARVAALLDAAGLSWVRRSALPASGGAVPAHCRVVLGDSMGELPGYYAAADLAFVAGSLLPHLGGHNVLEPALLGKPVLCGAHTMNFQDIVAAMARADAVRVVADAPALAAAATEWLTHADRRARWAANASAFVRANQGALGRTMAALADSGLLRPVSRDARHP